MKKIFLKLNRNPDQKVCWAEYRENQAITCNEDLLEDLSAKVGRHELIVLVPGEDVLLTSVKLPENSKFSKKAIPYALEEQLADDVDNLHFVHGHSRADGSRPVGVVAKERMSQWLNLLDDAGLETDLVFPDLLATPFEEGTITVLVDHGIALVRTGQQSGFTADLDNLETLIGAQLARISPSNVQLYGISGDFFKGEELRTLCSEACDDFSPLALMVKGTPTQWALNLRQGVFGRDAQWGAAWKSWRLPLAMAALLFIIHGVNLNMELSALRSESDSINAQMRKILTTSFPESKRLVKPYFQMENKLKALRKSHEQNDNLMSLLNQSAPIIRQRGSDGLQSLRYRNRKLDIDLHISDFKALDDLKMALHREADLDVEIKGATAKTGYVSAALQITAINN